MNKFQRIASDATVKSLVNAIIENGEIGEFAWPLRDAILETGELNECRDSLLVLLVAHEVYDSSDDVYDGNEFGLSGSKNIERLMGSPRLISVFDFDHCLTRLVGGEWINGGVFWQKGTWYIRKYGGNLGHSGEFVSRYSAPSILRELRRSTPMRPIPVE